MNKKNSRNDRNSSNNLLHNDIRKKRNTYEGGRMVAAWLIRNMGFMGKL